MLIGAPWYILLPMVLAPSLGGLGIGSAFTIWLQNRGKRRETSGSVETSDARTVFDFAREMLTRGNEEIKRLAAAYEQEHTLRLAAEREAEKEHDLRVACENRLAKGG